MSNFITDIGLEVHIQLNTQTKVFSSERAQFGDSANSNISYINLALPGTLPMLNRQVVDHAVKLGLALDCKVQKQSFFDRKHYVYPDLPKSYQITQDRIPVCIGGQFRFKSGNQEKTIRIHHIHIEEDAGKSIHDLDKNHSCIDLNRAGTPLLELVTEPDFHSGQEVHDFIDAIQKLLRFLDISSADMEKGELRADCNVSIRPSAEHPLGQRCEIKNLNSKKFAKQAIIYEVERQRQIIDAGDTVSQESRLFDPATGKTYTMRKKEEALDYRYCPEPDLGYLEIDDAWIDRIASQIRFLPQDVYEDLVNNYGIDPKKSENISSDIELTKAFLHLEPMVTNKKLLCDFVIQHLKKINRIEEILLANSPISNRIAEFLNLIDTNRLSASVAYQNMELLIIMEPEKSVEAIAIAHNLLIKAADEGHKELCKRILNEFPDKTVAYRKGKKNLIGFFMGQYMRQGDRSANPSEIQKIFIELLNSGND